MSLGGAWGWYVANRENVAPLLAPLVGGLVAWAALRQARIARLRHEEQTQADRARRITDTFSKAVEQLGSEKIEVRLGGIYTLERLSHEALASPRASVSMPDLYWTVMETLTGFVRERARWKVPQEDEPERPPPATDIAAVLDVIRRRPEAGQRHETQQNWRLDLNTTDLRRANLREAHLKGAILMGAHLEGAILMEAHLEGAKLVGAYLEGANLMGAHLGGANLMGAHLEGANLMEAHLEGAKLWGAHLEGANLIGAHLEEDALAGVYVDAKTVLPDGAHAALPS